MVPTSRWSSETMRRMLGGTAEAGAAGTPSAQTSAASPTNLLVAPLRLHVQDRTTRADRKRELAMDPSLRRGSAGLEGRQN
jgi:hypothetical protein